MANETFKVVGITTHNSNSKVRFADDLARRIKQFTKGGASRVDLIELPNPMTKVEALGYLKGHAQFQSAEDQATIDEALASRTKAPKEVKVSLDAIKARAKTKVTATETV